MSFLDLCYREAHGYPGKVPALAARMGKSPVILNNKLNAGCDHNHLTVDDAELLLDFTEGNRHAAEYFAHKANCAVIPLISASSSDIELLDAFMNVIRELGEFSAEFQRDWADGKIDQKEFIRLTADSDEVIACLLELRERIGQMVR